MSVKTRAAITADIAADYLTGSVGNISAADVRKGYDNINDSKSNVIKAVLDCSANPNYPASERGDTIPVSVAGKVGGASGKRVDAGDLIVCTADNAGGAESAVGTSFITLSSTRSGLVKLETAVVDLKTVADTTVSLPAGYTFFPTELNLVITAADTVTGQPTIRFGNTNNNAALLAAVATTNMTAVGNRSRYTTLVTANGQDETYNLTFGVTIAAAGTTLSGKAVFIGYFIKD